MSWMCLGDNSLTFYFLDIYIFTFTYYILILSVEWNYASHEWYSVCWSREHLRMLWSGPRGWREKLVAGADIKTEHIPGNSLIRWARENVAQARGSQADRGPASHHLCCREWRHHSQWLAHVLHQWECDQAVLVQEGVHWPRDNRGKLIPEST